MDIIFTFLSCVLDNYMKELLNWCYEMNMNFELCFIYT